MILELFGPSAAGKTTLASELVRVLQNQGHTVVLQTGDRRHPIRRAAFKLFSTLHLRWIRKRSLAADMLDVLPPRRELWAIRLKWHLEVLIRAWNKALASDDVISIFDQGMVQSVSSLVLLSGITDRESLARALDLVPKPDLLIRLQAPREILEARLRERRRNLGIIQQLLEVDLQSSLDHIDHVNLVVEQLKSSRVPTICVESLDASSLATAAEAIARQVRERRHVAPARSLVTGPEMDADFNETAHTIMSDIGDIEPLTCKRRTAAKLVASYDLASPSRGRRRW
ncbi:AAA family ATPase [Mesorhizobium sp. dw_380]|uniref:AAA family ATPase n=1 Tax=Mesorhizobium sp. dw_380 TaxID=2812001 RepID=UPI001BDE4AE4|nr:AAA family ATPase [Mesorhizobium sp. dw_380]